jgi:hypothetical protein
MIFTFIFIKNTLSPIPLQKQLSSIVGILDNQLKFKHAFIGSFEKDYISIQNHNDSLSKIGVQYIIWQMDR